MAKEFGTFLDTQIGSPIVANVCMSVAALSILGVCSLLGVPIEEAWRYVTVLFIAYAVMCLMCAFEPEGLAFLALIVGGLVFDVLMVAWALPPTTIVVLSSAVATGAFVFWHDHMKVLPRMTTALLFFPAFAVFALLHGMLELPVGLSLLLACGDLAVQALVARIFYERGQNAIYTRQEVAA